VKEKINKLVENAAFKETTTQDFEDDVFLLQAAN